MGFPASGKVTSQYHAPCPDCSERTNTILYLGALALAPFSVHTIAVEFQPKSQGPAMVEFYSFVHKGLRQLFGPVSSKQAQQRRLMATALTLLVAAFILVLYHNRDFWFPDAENAEDEVFQSGPAVASSSSAENAVKPSPHKKTGKPQLIASAQPVPGTPPIVVTRTVLPPLEVEVVAGDTHRKLRPTSNAVELDVQPDSSDQAADRNPDQPQESNAELAENATQAGSDEPAARVTDKASERFEMSPETSDAVNDPVRPGYPVLAREMKVQGSVILLAMIGRDGLIQDLRTLSGPPILSGAAREAVKQWHFKPHYEGNSAVETVARITVNFTISTN